VEVGVDLTRLGQQLQPPIQVRVATAELGPEEAGAISLGMNITGAAGHGQPVLEIGDAAHTVAEVTREETCRRQHASPDRRVALARVLEGDTGPAQPIAPVTTPPPVKEEAVDEIQSGNAS
jgi:hypothetical protein